MKRKIGKVFLDLGAAIFYGFGQKVEEWELNKFDIWWRRVYLIPIPQDKIYRSNADSGQASWLRLTCAT